jgi:tetratricopeptide (TPR) repeat protein
MKKLGFAFAAAAAAALALVMTSIASADTPPSKWDRAKDPEQSSAFDLHEAVHRRLLLSRDNLPPALRQLNDAELRTVKTMLENANAEKSKSPLLRFDLALVYSELKDHRRAADIYRQTIKDFPDHQAVERAWLRLAFACGHLGDHVCERDAYVKVLQIETEEVLRATPTLNLAETQMHLGDLKDAIEGYREALRIAGRVGNNRETAPLATWGLAVALDRAGDRLAAEKEARFALEIERSMGMHRLLRSEDVFFVPAYEIHWYEGLGSAARARVATSSRDAATLWKQAEKSFSDYIAASEKSKEPDRWLPLAKARLRDAKTERESAEKKAPREKPEPSPFEPELKL